MNRVLLAAAMAIGLGAMLAPDVRACTCVPRGELAADIAEAELAFVGTVVASRDAPEVRLLGGTSLVASTFVVERASAETSERIVVHAPHGADQGACGITFGLGERWLVRAYREKGVIASSVCSAIGQVDELTADEMALVARLLSHSPAPSPDPAFSWTGIAVPALVAAGAAMLAITLLARDRRGTRRSA
jgi:hypothetical protein